ncbi:MAG TPA: hypothetical protein VNO30_43850 [Kofleriaceae bacterium]|nr:hypothetical protein [Kofleriaceae bacterium]
MNEPLGPDRVRVLVRQALDSGQVTFGDHALKALDDDKMSTADAQRTLRGGVAEPGEFVSGEWRYRIRTERLIAVVRFKSFEPLKVRVVTCFARQQRR